MFTVIMVIAHLLLIDLNIHNNGVISGHLTCFAHLQNFNFVKKSKALSRLCKLSHFKLTGRSCTDTVQEKVPSFQKVTLLV